jgi:Na+/proline symporter
MMPTLATTESLIRDLSGWDYTVIFAYLVFTLSIGMICRRLNRNASDYFRGGGNMTWWVGGLSAMGAGISVWTFTGGAAKCYNDGFVFPLVGMLAAVPSLIVGLLMAPRFRRMRVITSMEAVFRRFGFGTEQFYTWFSLPMGLFWGGIGLNAVGVFMASVFRMDLTVTILAIGCIITFLSALGGQWAVAIGGVVQAVLLLLVVLVVVFFSVNLPEIGGITHLYTALPARHFHFDTDCSFAIVWLWVGYGMVSNTIGGLDIRNCGRFVRVKNDRSARQMVLLCAAPTFLLLAPVLYQLPAFCAATVFPDLQSVFPNLTQPAEGAWIAMAFKVLPQGLLGLMVCAMFSASIDSGDAALNSNAGFFVRNVYISYIRPDASEKRQVIVGKITTVCFGLLIIGVGLGVNALRTLNLFDLFQVLNAILLPPMIVPMVLGVVIRRTPAWAGWSTVIAGLVIGLLAKWAYSPEMVQHLLGLTRALSAREFNDSQAIFVGSIAWVGSALWFCGTIPLWRMSSEAHHQRVNALFADMKRPVDHIAEGGQDQDTMQLRVVGALFLILGAFLLACMAIPNPLSGRLAFLFVGGVLFALGLLLWTLYQRKAARAAKTREESLSARQVLS